MATKTKLVIRKKPESSDLRQRGRKYILRLLRHFTEKELVELEEAIYKCAQQKNSTRGIRSDSPEADECYIALMMLVTKNLDPTSTVRNSYLLPLVKDGTIPLLSVPSMSPAEMFPERWKDHLKKSAAEANQVARGELVATTSVIRCKCGSPVTYKEMQMRSADEAMTLIVRCPTCGNKFNI